MPGSTPEFSLPYPTYGDPVNPAAEMQALAEAVNAVLETQLAKVATIREKSAGGMSATASQSIPNNTFTRLTFTTEDFDNANMVRIATDNSQLFPAQGLYFVTAMVLFTTNGTGDREVTMSTESGATFAGIEASSTGFTGSTHRLAVGGLVQAFDLFNPRFRVSVRQTSGSVLSVTNRYLHAVRLS